MAESRVQIGSLDNVHFLIVRNNRIIQTTLYIEALSFIVGRVPALPQVGVGTISHQWQNEPESLVVSNIVDMRVGDSKVFGIEVLFFRNTDRYAGSSLLSGSVLSSPDTVDWNQRYFGNHLRSSKGAVRFASMPTS